MWQLARRLMLGGSLAVGMTGGAFGQSGMIDVPAEDLETALSAFIRQSGVELLYNPQQVAGLKSRAVHGTDPASELDNMLRGSGLLAKRDPSGVFFIVNSLAGGQAPRPAMAGRQSAAGIASFSAVALAQGSQVEQVVVSASRVVRDGYNAPTPITVVDSESIRKAAEPNVFVAINQMPSMIGGSNSVYSGAASTGLTGLASFNMRGLGTNRTLVLLDGQRVVGAANTGIADIAEFPQGLIERVDVVTGGASASWGSDAVAGVVNFVLEKKFEGLKGNVEFGETKYGDDKQAMVQVTAGSSFLGGKLHAEASAEFSVSPGVPGASTRPWYVGTKMLQNSIAGTAAGMPQYIVAQHVTNVQFAPGGLITSQGTALSASIVGIKFGTGGAPSNFQFGSPTIGFGTVGGDQSSDLGGGTDLDFKQNRGTFFARVSYDLTPTTGIWASANYGEVLTSQHSAGSQWKAASLTIQCDNPFLPGEIATACGGAGHAFGFGTQNKDMRNSLVHNVRTLRRYAMGGDGAFGLFGKDWAWDAYYEHGENDIDNSINNLSFTPYYNAAIDAVRTPGGAIVCRSAVAQALGCVPMNVIGTGMVSPAADNWVNDKRGAWRVTDARQEAASFSVNGEPFSNWAGPVSVAAGIEYREEAFRQQNDPYSSGSGGNPLMDPNGSNWWIGNFHSGKGSYHIFELFNEDVIPLFKNTDFGGADFTMAGRATGYSSSGYISTWKLGLTWDTPIEGVRIRTLKSRDIRAPTLADLYAGPTVLLSTLIDDFAPKAGQSISVLQNQTGNTALSPEIGTTEELGVIYQPAWLPGFSASADYYRIGVKGAISGLTLQQEMDLCFQGNAAQCALIAPDPRNNIVPTQITLQQINLSSVKTDGFDIETSYRTATDTLLGFPGNLSLRILATHVSKFLTDSGLPNQPVLEAAGQNASGAQAAGQNGPVGQIATWRWLGIASYDNDDLSASLTGRWVAPGVVNKAYIECAASCPLPTQNHPTINDNQVNGAFYVDVGGSYNLTGAGGRASRQIYFKIDNLANVDPPPATGPNANIHNGVNAQLYDVLGRFYHIGLRFAE